MVFNSIAFVIFLPIVFLIYWAIPDKIRWLLVLVASYYFYMSWDAKYVVLIFATTFVSYVAGILLETYKNDNWIRKLTLIVTLGVCLGILLFFKYFNFISKSVADVLGLFTIKLNPITLNVLLPVGISFYTFQTLSYVIDVYRGDVKAEHHFGIYAAFISFFPQLVAGPIERPRDLLPQIKSKKVFDYTAATYGLKLMAWGYFKKMVIADTLAVSVDKIFDDVYNYHGFSLVLVALFFTIQIYCDFSGYSDIAIGTAKLMGINLMTNFKSPYFSSSIKEFWSRWHISLSTWFRDYVYIPLGGNKVSSVRHKINLMITFLVSGLWHGANWTFVLWGGVHGFVQVIETIFGIKKVDREQRKALWFVRTLVVFVFCTLAWIFFRAETISDAGYFLSHWMEGITSPISYFHQGIADIAMNKRGLLEMIIFIGMLTIYDYVSIDKDVIKVISSKTTIVRWFLYFVIVAIIVGFAQTSNEAQFIYFQF